MKNKNRLFSILITNNYTGEKQELITNNLMVVAGDYNKNDDFVATNIINGLEMDTIHASRMLMSLTGVIQEEIVGKEFYKHSKVKINQFVKEE